MQLIKRKSENRSVHVAMYIKDSTIIGIMVMVTLGDLDYQELLRLLIANSVSKLLIIS